jgi:PAS domain S-box-containing protein
MSPPRILVVEDERIVARDIQLRLRRLGYEVVGATRSGEEAVRLTGELRPDLVLMDIRLDGATDGVAAAQEIHDRFQLPVVYLTAYADDDTLRRACVTEPFGYILKPFDERELRTVIEMALYKHRSDRKLRESERRYAVTLSSIGDAVIATDERARVRFINPTAATLTGWPPDRAAGRPLAEVFRIINEHTRQPAEDPAAKVLHTGATVGLANHTVLLSRDGREVPIDDCGAPILDDRGNLTGVVLVFHDISERREAARALETSEHRYRLLFERNMAGVLRNTLDGQILEVNDAFAWLLGYESVEEVRGRPVADHYHDPADREAMLARLRAERVLTNYELRLRRKDGRPVWVLANIILYDDEQGRPVVQGTVIDITDRREAAEALTLFRALIDRTTDAVEVVDPRTGRLLDMNETACLAHGYTREEYLALSVWDLDPTFGQAGWADHVARLRAVGSLTVGSRHRRKDGSTFPVEVNVTYIRLNRDYMVAVVRDVTERERAEAALRRTADLLKAVADGTTDAVFVKDRAGKYLLFNEAAARFVGKPVAEVLGKDDTELFEPQSARVVMDGDRRVMASGHAETAEETLTAAGVTRTYQVTKAPYRDEAGNMIGLVGISRDITAQKRAEQALRDSEQRFRTFVDHATDAFLLHDDRGVILDVNQQACESLGYSREELVGKTPLDFNPDVDQARLDEIQRRLDAGDLITTDRRHRRKDGLIFPVEIRIRPFWEGGRRFGVALVRDITERKRADDALRRSEETLRRAQAIGHVGSWLFEVDEGMFVGSDEGNRMCGWGPGPHRAEELLAIVHPDDLPRMQAAWQATLAGGPYEIEHRLVVGGQVVWVSVRAEPEADPSGRVVRITGVTQDVTERRRLEEQLRQAQKMEAVGQLAGGVAHDFNNLLTVINGYSELVFEGLPPGDPARDLLDQIKRAGERSAGLTRQLLAFSRRQVLSPQVLDLNAVVADAEKLLRRLIGEDVRLTTDLAPGLGAVRADPGQIEQVLLNLAVNARDAMPTGGRLTVATRNVELGDDFTRTHPDARPGRYVLLAVSDTGCGMTAEVKPRIFEPFFTTKGPGKGTGLGLATVYGIVQQSDGWVEVESEPGAGATFRMYLPRVERASGAWKLEPRVPTLPHGTETVLVVEDEDGVRALTQRILRRCGYTVLEAANGEEAMRVAAGHGGPIHLLVTDVVMPGPGGPVVAEWLTAERAGLRVLFMSGYTDDAVVRHGVLHASANFLQKPFSPVALAHKVREVLDSAAPDSPP